MCCETMAKLLALLAPISFFLGLRENDAVATPPPFTHATRRLSCGRIDGVEAPRHRDDAAT